MCKDYVIFDDSNVESDMELKINKVKEFLGLIDSDKVLVYLAYYKWNEQKLFEEIDKLETKLVEAGVELKKGIPNLNLVKKCPVCFDGLTD